MRFRILQIFFGILGFTGPAKEVFAGSFTPPVRVGVAGLNSDTGERIWEAWSPEQIPQELKGKIPPSLFGKYYGEEAIRPARPKFGFPCKSGEYSIHIDGAEKKHLPGEVTLIRTRNGQEIGKKTFSNAGICVNALGEHFYHISQSGMLRVFAIAKKEDEKLWKPVRRFQLFDSPLTEDDPPPIIGGTIRSFVDRGELIVQTGKLLISVSENGEEKWQADTSDFYPGNEYGNEPEIHFLEDFLFFQDGQQIAKFDRKTGERLWESDSIGSFLSPDATSLLVFPESSQIAISVAYYLHRSLGRSIDQRFYFERSDLGIESPRRQTLTEREHIEFLGFIAEIRALGSRAMQVHLAEILNDPDRIPTDQRAEVKALIETEWPEFRSEKRMFEYLINGLRSPPAHTFDRVAAWRAIFPSQWHEIERWQEADSKYHQPPLSELPVYEFWPGTELNDSDFMAVGSLARETFETQKGVEKAFAALVLTKLAGQIHGFTKSETNQLTKNPDYRLKAIGTLAWAWHADRDSVFERMSETSDESHFKDILKQCLSLHPLGDLSDREVAFWSAEAEAMEGRYLTRDFVECFRIAQGGMFPPAFEAAVRKVLRQGIEDPKLLNFAKFQALCNFDNPSDDDLIAEYEKFSSDPSYLIDPVIAKREKRMSEAD